MKKIAIISAALAVLCSCQALKEEFQPVFTGSYDNPEPYTWYSDSDFSNIVSIKDLCACYSKKNPFVMPGSHVSLANAVIKGRVSTTDRPGNFYKSLYIEDGTAGIELKIGKNGLYNDYQQGQTVYVKLGGLSLGMYGYKDGNNGGQGMVQIGYEDPSGDYETAYLELSKLIDAHILRGDPADIRIPEPLVIDKESGLPNSKTEHQGKNGKLGRLVTLKGLKYANEVFCLLYLNSQKDKEDFANRVFLSSSNNSDPTCGVTTLAMSETKMTEYLLSGAWDQCKVGSGSNYAKDDQGNIITIGSLKGNGRYPGVEKAAYSVSQYFKMGSTEIQIRTSGYCRFSDYEIPEDVLSGKRAIDVTGILTNYQGSLQLVVNSAADFVYSDTKEPLYN